MEGGKERREEREGYNRGHDDDGYQSGHGGGGQAMKRRARAEGGEGEEEDSRGNGAQRSAHPIKGAGNGDMTTVMRKIKLV